MSSNRQKFYSLSHKVHELNAEWQVRIRLSASIRQLECPNNLMLPSPHLRTYQILERLLTLSELCAHKLFHVDIARCLRGAGAVPRSVGTEAYTISGGPL